MSKRYSNLPPAEANQPPENIIVSGSTPALPQMAAALRTPRPIKDSDVLFRVELALSRLENGDYGYCIRCYQPIAIEKLEVDPSAVICDGCCKPNA